MQSYGITKEHLQRLAVFALAHLIVDHILTGHAVIRGFAALDDVLIFLAQRE